MVLRDLSLGSVTVPQRSLPPARPRARRNVIRVDRRHRVLRQQPGWLRIDGADAKEYSPPYSFSHLAQGSAKSADLAVRSVRQRGICAQFGREYAVRVRTGPSTARHIRSVEIDHHGSETPVSA
jgi:hypothetical protein